MTTPFELQGVVHLVRPAGLAARGLEELRECIAAAPEASLFYHTVQCVLRHPDSEDLPPDDLSAWVAGVVQDGETAERLAFAAQSGSRSGGELRGELLATLDRLPVAARRAREAPEDGAFEFLTMEPVRVPTGVVVDSGAALMDALAAADAAVWFNHLFEEPWFRPEGSSLVRWLEGAGEARLARLLEECAAEVLPLRILRRRALRRWSRTGLARRVAAAASVPEDERREVAHTAVVGLVRRITQREEP